MEESWLKQLGVTDLLGIYSDYQKNKLAANAVSTKTELENQVSLLTMQRDMFNNYAQMMAQQSLSSNNVQANNWLPLLLIGGVVVFAVFEIGK